MRLPTFCLAWFLIFTASAWGEDLIISRSVLTDPSGTLSIHDVEQARFQPAGPILSGGYTRAIHWIRLQVKAPATGTDVVLRIRPTYLDEIRLYEPDPDSPGQWNTALTGDRYPYYERGTISPGFTVHPHKPYTTYYLRLSTSSSSLLSVEALTPVEAQIKDMRLDMAQLVYLGIMLSMLFWAAFDYFLNPQPITVNFLVFQLGYILFNLALMGYLAPIVPAHSPQWADQATNFFVVTIVFLAIVFHRSLFLLFSPPPLLIRCLEALGLIYPFQLIAMYSGHPQIALQTNAIIALLLGPLLLLLALTSRKESPPGLRMLRIVFTIQFISLLISILPLLGLIKAVTWSLFATLMHGGLSAMLVFWMLILRSRQIQRDSQSAVLELKLSNQKLCMEQARSEEHNRFISMLTHELKTPMSVIRMTLGALGAEGRLRNNAEAALQDMHAVVELCQQVDLLEQKQLTPRPAPCRIESILYTLQCKCAAPQMIAFNFEPLPEINNDRQLIQIILDNLISNAIKYSAPESEVLISALVSAQGGKSGVAVKVQNLPGPAGFPERNKLFNKYYRSPGAHRKTGTGLGLYLSKSLALTLNGTLDYDVFDEKVIFTLWLPV